VSLAGTTPESSTTFAILVAVSVHTKNIHIQKKKKSFTPVDRIAVCVKAKTIRTSKKITAVAPHFQSLFLYNQKKKKGGNKGK